MHALHLARALLESRHQPQHDGVQVQEQRLLEERAHGLLVPLFRGLDGQPHHQVRLSGERSAGVPDDGHGRGPLSVGQAHGVTQDGAHARAGADHEQIALADGRGGRVPHDGRVAPEMHKPHAEHARDQTGAAEPVDEDAPAFDQLALERQGLVFRDGLQDPAKVA